LDQMQQNSRSGARQVPPSEGRRRKLFSEVMKGEEDRRYKITLKAKNGSQSPEQIKLQLKKDINPTDIKLGIKTLQPLRDGRILIETRSEEEINSLSSVIGTKCGEQLEIIKHRLRKPRLIIYISEEITIENVTAIIQAQTYNIVIEVGPQTQKQILQTKLKIGWEICNVEDYLVPTRCYRCSR